MDSLPLRPGLVRDEVEHCATCGKTREEHDKVRWPHTWLPRTYVREVGVDLIEKVQALADALWQESQQDSMIIRDAGIIQDIVLRIDAITGAPERI